MHGDPATDPQSFSIGSIRPVVLVVSQQAFVLTLARRLSSQWSECVDAPAIRCMSTWTCAVAALGTGMTAAAILIDATQMDEPRARHLLEYLQMRHRPAGLRILLLVRDADVTARRGGLQEVIDACLTVTDLTPDGLHVALSTAVRSYQRLRTLQSRLSMVDRLHELEAALQGAATLHQWGQIVLRKLANPGRRGLGPDSRRAAASLACIHLQSPGVPRLLACTGSLAWSRRMMRQGMLLRGSTQPALVLDIRLASPITTHVQMCGLGTPWHEFDDAPLRCGLHLILAGSLEGLIQRQARAVRTGFHPWPSELAPPLNWTLLARTWQCPPPDDVTPADRWMRILDLSRTALAAHWGDSMAATGHLQRVARLSHQLARDHERLQTENHDAALDLPPGTSRALPWALALYGLKFLPSPNPFDREPDPGRPQLGDLLLDMEGPGMVWRVARDMVADRPSFARDIASIAIAFDLQCQFAGSSCQTAEVQLHGLRQLVRWRQNQFDRRLLSRLLSQCIRSARSPSS